MNEISVISNNPAESLSSSISNRVHSNRSEKSDNGSDFSAVFKKANEARTESRPRKKDEPKTSDDAAYAAAQANAAPARAETPKAEETEATASVEAISYQTSAETVTEVAEQPVVIPDVAPDVAPDVTFDELLAQMDGNVTPDTTDIPQFLASVVTEMDEQLGETMQAILPVETPEAPKAGKTENTGTTEQTVAAADAPVEESHVQAAQTNNDQSSDQPSDSEDEQTVVLPERKEHRADHGLFMQRVKERIAARIAARQNAEAEKPVEQITETAPAQETEVTEPVVSEIQTEEQPLQTGETKSADKPKDTPAVYEYSHTIKTSYQRVSVEEPFIPVSKVTVQDIVNQLVDAFKMSKLEGGTLLELQLRPEQLGKVNILIASGDDGLTAQIKVPNDRVNNMLSIGLSDLAYTLKEMGINMKNISIANNELAWDFARGDMGSRQSGQENKGQENNQGGNARHNGSVVQLQNQIRASSMLYGNLALYPLMDEDVSVEFRA